MIRKFTHILALFIGIVAYGPSLPGEFSFEHPAPIPFAGGVLQPFTSSLQYDVTEPPARRQQTVDERIYGTSSAPAGGAGLIWTLGF